MKKTILMLAAGGLLLLVPSCKKGEGDPALSFSSRKARLAGTWEMTGYDYNSRNDETDGDYQTTSETLSGSTITTTYSDYDAGSGTTTSTTSTTTLDKAEYVIEKDGTFSMDYNTTTVSSNDYTDIWTGDEHTETTTTVSTSTVTGNWSFIGAVKEGDVTYKNKERIVLNWLTSTGTSSSSTTDMNNTQGTSTTNDNGSSSWTSNYYSGEMSMTYALHQLKGKEMIWKAMESNSGSSSWTSGGTTVSTTDDVYTSDETITFTIKK